ncbi:hypothetical protein ACH5AL_28020 [Actinacidiphila glaucinigra]|uniref:hypothetical protein n=1 Tax=Actinacidiphila glaucinigra TaxID=235986 RepID=UPI00379A5D25
MGRATDSLEAVPALAADGSGRIDLDRLTRQEILDLRSLAAENPELIEVAIDAFGENDARRLYTHHVVDQVLRHRGGGGRVVLQQRWEAA